MGCGCDDRCRFGAGIKPFGASALHGNLGDPREGSCDRAAV
jgi:hypothetical protein